MILSRVNSLEFKKEWEGWYTYRVPQYWGKVEKYFFQLFSVHGVNDVRQTDIHTVETLVREPSAWGWDGYLKAKKTQPCIVQILAELIKAGGRKIHTKIHNLLILFGIKRNCLRSGRSRSFYPSIRATKQTVVITEAYHFCQLNTQFYPTSCCQS
jgi:hypothetical protein